MPRNPLDGLPFPPLRVFDQDAPIQPAQISNFFQDRDKDDGVGLLLRNENGHLDRGGYFFISKRMVRISSK